MLSASAELGLASSPPAPLLPAPAPPIDTTATHLLARGCRQRQWLAALLTTEGLSPAQFCGPTGRCGTWASVMGFVEVLQAAGYRVAWAPTGPRGGRRARIIGFDLRLGRAIRAVCTGTGSLRHESPDQIWADLAGQPDEVVEIVTGLAPGWSAPWPELLGVAISLARRP